MSAEHEVARRYMVRKGYPAACPERVLRIKTHVWIFEYDIDGGMLTLEVAWSQGEGWQAKVYDYLAA